MTPALVSDRVGDLVARRPARARLFEQLGIDYCCGGRRLLDEACRERGLDPVTVAVLMAAVDDTGSGLIEDDWGRATLVELCDHIVDVHHAYLRRELPRLSALLAKCVRAHADERPELPETRATFERLRDELELQLVAEECTVFAACRRFAAGEPLVRGVGGALAEFEAEHTRTGALLARLSSLTRGYDSEGALCTTHRAALHALRDLAHDLHEHIHEENNILFPRARAVFGP